MPGYGGHDPLLKERGISGLRISRSDGAVYVDGHPVVAKRLPTFLLRRISIFYQVGKAEKSKRGT